MTTASATTMLDAALEYAARGVPVFPVFPAIDGRCACRRAECDRPAKHPIGSLVPNGLKDATTDAATIREWWRRSPHANIARRTDLCTVLDVDPLHGGDETLAELQRVHGPLPDTAEVITGSGGRHIYFRLVPGLSSSTGRVGPGLDIKTGDGAYVLLPPSTHVSGGTYHDDVVYPLFDTPLATAPAWLVTRASAPANSNGCGGHGDTDWAALLSGAPAGQRHDIAVRIAGHYLGKKLPSAEVEEILIGFAMRCSPPFDVEDCRRIVRDLAAKDRAHDNGQPSGNGTQPGDGPELVRLSDVAPEAVDWMWANRIARGKFGLIIGEPGDGKTSVAIYCASQGSRGSAWPDGGAAPFGATVLLTSEDGIADTLRPRVDRQGGDPEQIYVLRSVRVAGEALGFNLERDLPALETAIRRTGAVLVIADPLSAYLGKKDSYKDAEIRGILTPLADLAERLRVAVVGILHLTKAAQRRLLLRALASVGFVAQARTVLAVGQDQNVPGRRLLVSVKNNLGPDAPGLAFRISDAGVVWEPGTVEGTAEKLLALDELPSRSERHERDLAATFLRDLLRGGAVPSRQVEADAKANGIAQRTLWRAKADLGIVAERVQAGNRWAWSWSLPGGDEA